MSIIIDTQASIDALRKVGFKDDQARALIDTVLPLTRAEDLSTKQDLQKEVKNLETKIDSLRNELKYFAMQLALGQTAVIVGVIIAIAKF